MCLFVFSICQVGETGELDVPFWTAVSARVTVKCDAPSRSLAPTVKFVLLLQKLPDQLGHHILL
jgi:hypothetical protein